jgi:hypothetical protein
MASKQDTRVTLTQETYAFVGAIAKLRKCSVSDVIEQALQLVADPLPPLLLAQQLIAAFQAQVTEVRDQVAVIAEYVVDAHRTTVAKGNIFAARDAVANSNGKAR